MFIAMLVTIARKLQWLVMVSQSINVEERGKLQNQISFKLVFAYFILVVGTLANLVIWTDFRPTPFWLILSAGLESLLLLNIWFGRLIAKQFWEKSVRISFWIVFYPIIKIN